MIPDGYPASSMKLSRLCRPRAGGISACCVSSTVKRPRRAAHCGTSLPLPLAGRPLVSGLHQVKVCAREGVCIGYATAHGSNLNGGAIAAVGRSGLRAGLLMSSGIRPLLAHTGMPTKTQGRLNLKTSSTSHRRRGFSSICQIQIGRHDADHERPKNAEGRMPSVGDPSSGWCACCLPPGPTVTSQLLRGPWASDSACRCRLNKPGWHYERVWIALAAAAPTVHSVIRLTGLSGFCWFGGPRMNR